VVEEHGVARELVRGPLGANGGLSLGRRLQYFVEDIATGDEGDAAGEEDPVRDRAAFDKGPVHRLLTRSWRRAAPLSGRRSGCFLGCARSAAHRISVYGVVPPRGAARGAALGQNLWLASLCRRWWH